MENKDLVSIIMLSRNQERYLEESIRSVINQTYKNWELLFVDDSSKDKTIEKMMDLKAEGRLQMDDGSVVDRIKVSRTVYLRGFTNNRNSSLKEAKGKYIAFLNVGDVWASNKLEKQVAFMKGHGIAFSYHQYSLMDSLSQDRGFLVSGKEHLTHKDFLKCCWPGYLTVMYDAEKVKYVQVKAPQNNDFALWLYVSDSYDCYLLPEALATMRTKWNRMGKFLLSNNFSWRYDAYRLDENFKPMTSFFFTIRNGLYGVLKWWKYVNRVR